MSSSLSSSSNNNTSRHRRSRRQDGGAGAPAAFSHQHGLRRADTVRERGSNMPLTLFHHLQGANSSIIRRQKSFESLNGSIDEQQQQQSSPQPNRHQPAPELLVVRRHAIVPEEKQQLFDGQNGDSDNNGGTASASDNVLIVPHMQISSNESHLFNRAITSGGSILAELQRATIASQTFYADNRNDSKRSPWILKRLYEWSHRAKTREIVRHTAQALNRIDLEFHDDELIALMNCDWQQLFPGCCDGHLSANDQKRLQNVWELMNSELKFLYQQLLVLRNVYKEPLKQCQVEGCLLGVEPDLLFGNLDQLCQISISFCRQLAKLIDNVCRTSDNYNCTDTIFSKGPSTISVYQAYCINYKATMEYLACIRQRDERFIEFEQVCLADERCHRLQLEDLLIAPLQRITRLPILLKEIQKHTDSIDDRNRIERVIESMQESLRSIDDSVQWLHNFERLQQLQTQVIWLSIFEMEPRAYIPEFLKVALSRQFCENLLAHPRRKLLHEGHLECIENGKTSDVYVFLFNDMCLLTKAKKLQNRPKVKPVTKYGYGAFYQKLPTGSSTFAPKTDQYQYVVLRQPIPLDSCVFCDTECHDSSVNTTPFAFVIIHLTRFYQVVSVYTLQAATKLDKELWIEKFQESIENYESIQLKDMLKCTPLLSNWSSLRRCSSNRQMTNSSMPSQ